MRASIEDNGLIEPVTMLEGKILDGRNRAAACLMLGIEPATVDYTGDDPLGFVLAKNLNRRHLNESQRAMVAAKIATLPPYRPKSASIEALKSQQEIADALNVSRSSVQRAAKLQREAATEVVEQVERGEKSVHAALKETQENDSERDHMFTLESKTKNMLKMVRESFNILNAIKREATHEFYWQCLTAMDDLHSELYDHARKGENDE